MEHSDNTHVIAPTKEHTHTVIFLHGRDSTAPEFADEFFESQASDNRTLTEIFPGIRWVFPSSGLWNSARFEMELSQWFDIWSVEEPEGRKELQVDGLKESIVFILNVVYSEASLVSAERIVLGGISQGCATAILALMHCSIQLGGFIGLCGWLPFQEEIEAIAKNTASADLLQGIRNLFKSTFSESCKITPNLQRLNENSESALATSVLLSHAMDDEAVPFSNGEGLRQGLDHLGMTVTWKAYADGGHWINEPQGVDDIVAFLQKKF